MFKLSFLCVSIYAHNDDDDDDDDDDDEDWILSSFIITVYIDK